MSGEDHSSARRSGATSLLLDVTGRDEPTKSARLQEAIREAVRDGRLAAHDRLPSTRSLAGELGWARNVVVDAFDQLIAEGYLTARVGEGTRVADRPIDRRATETASALTDAPPTIDVDLQPGVPDLVGFPTREWRRSWNDALDRTVAGDLGYGDGAGAPELRDALARYLARSRATDLDSSCLMVTTGVSAALRLLAMATMREGRPTTFAVEDPGAYTQRLALEAAGAVIVPIPVDGDGIDTASLAHDRSDVDVVVVTPAHQYPLGGVLAPSRRAQLIEWARARPGRLIIEDDYDAEFRYDRRPVGSIQGVAPDVTGITSSVSKTLAPALRLGWLGLPQPTAERVAAQLRAEFLTPDVVQQRALAELIDSGRYDRIVRARRQTYRRRRELMVEAISSIPGCTVPGAAGGLHLTVLLPERVDDVQLSEHLLNEGIDVPPLARYRIRPGPPGLVASFAAATSGDVARFAAALHSAI